MKPYRVIGSISISTWTVVEAESEEEAIELANERTDMMQILSNNGDSELECWMAEELDGVPTKLHIEN